MERTYESAKALAGRAAGPLSSHLGAFVASLIEQQYAACVIHIKVRHALSFDRWLAKRRIGLAGLGEVHIERFQSRIRRVHRRIRVQTRQLERREVAHLLRFLRAQGVCPAAHVQTTAAEAMAARFEQHLQQQQGLAATTIERYRTVAEQFLEYRFGRGAVDLTVLRAADSTAFIRLQSQHLHPLERPRCALPASQARRRRDPCLSVAETQTRKSPRSSTHHSHGPTTTGRRAIRPRALARA